MEPKQKQRWDDLAKLLDRVDRRGYPSLSVDEVKQLCRLYRQVTVDLSRARTNGDDPELIHFLNHLAARAHGHVYASRKVDLRPLLGFVIRGFPQLVRRRGPFVLVASGSLLVTAFLSYLAVIRSPQLAYSLFDENIVEMENIRLERQQGEYRGNFTFELSASPVVALGIILNNVRVAIMVFAFGALGCLPGVLLLLYNGRMLGTLTGLVAIHGFVGDFYALILTHGVLELTAICISGSAGLILGWALMAPGVYSRREALRRAAPDAFGLLGGAAVMLIVAGHIEAYITPHFSQAVRWTVAVLSALFLIAYIGLGGRASRESVTAVPER
jgi:uncharacterized membrane protein SpoIIM required for sporulation